MTENIKQTIYASDGVFRCGKDTSGTEYGKCPPNLCCLENGICALNGGISCNSDNKVNQKYNGDIVDIDMIGPVPIINMNLPHSAIKISMSGYDNNYNINDQLMLLTDANRINNNSIQTSLLTDQVNTITNNINDISIDIDKNIDINELPIDNSNIIKKDIINEIEEIDNKNIEPFMDCLLNNKYISKYKDKTCNIIIIILIIIAVYYIIK